MEVNFHPEVLGTKAFKPPGAVGTPSRNGQAECNIYG